MRHTFDHRPGRFARLVTVTLVAAACAPAAAQAADVNHDRIPDRWEVANHLGLKVDQRARDQDHDGLRNLAEFRDHTNPRRADSDRDGTPDGREDADHDGTTNLAEQPPAPGKTAGNAETEPSGPGTGDAPDTSPAPPAGAPGDASRPGEPEPGEHPPVFDHVVSYAADGGRLLTLARSDASTAAARADDHTSVECSTTNPGGPYAPCPKSRLVPGAHVVYARKALVDGVDTWTLVLVLGPAPAEPTPPVPPAPATVPAPTPGGTIAGWTGGVLTIDRPSGTEHPAGPLAAGATIRCLHVHDGVVTSVESCSADALVPGRKVGLTQRAVTEGVARWTRVDILVAD